MINYQKIYLKGIVITLIIITVIAIPFLFTIRFDYVPTDSISNQPVTKTSNNIPSYRWIQLSIQLILGCFSILLASKLFAKRMVKRPTQFFTNNLLVTLLLWICFMPIGMLDDVFGKSFPIDFESIVFGWLVFGGVLFTIIAVIHAIILYPILIYLNKKQIKKIGTP